MADTIKVTIESDLSAILSSFQGEEAKDALELLTRTVEADMRPYVKKDTGALEASAESNSRFREGVIVYTATRGYCEYAGYAYEDPNVASTDRNPKATSHWDEAAADERMDEWEQLIADALTGDAA